MKDVVEMIKSKYKELSNKDGKVVLQVNADTYKKMMKGRGIDGDTVKRFSDVISDTFNGCVEAGSELLADSYPDAKKIEVRVRTPFGRSDVRITKVKTGKVPKTNEPYTKYGSISATLKTETLLNADVVAACEKRMEELAG